MSSADDSIEACERLFTLHDIESDEERERQERYRRAVAQGDQVTAHVAWFQGQIRAPLPRPAER